MDKNALFGEQRLVRSDKGRLEKLFFKTIGIADPAHFLHYKYFRLALGSLDPLFQPRRILDIGCGRGDFSFYLARLFPSAEVIGIDISKDSIERNIAVCKALGIGNLQFQRVSILDVSYENKFDLMVCIDVLEHIEMQDEAFHRIAGCLSESGYAYYHIPTIRKRPVPFSGMLGDFHLWAQGEHVAKDRSAEEFREMIVGGGLTLVYFVQTFGYFTGELANSLFVLPYRKSSLNTFLQAAFSPFCRLLALMDPLLLEHDRFAVAMLSRKMSVK